MSAFSRLRLLVSGLERGRGADQEEEREGGREVGVAVSVVWSSLQNFVLPPPLPSLLQCGTLGRGFTKRRGQIRIELA